jgi:hypothetical protein
MTDHIPIPDPTDNVLTLEEANEIEWREPDLGALDADSIWDAVDRMQEAQTLSRETLTCEISV